MIQKDSAAGTVFVCVLISTLRQVMSCCPITEFISPSQDKDFDFNEELNALILFLTLDYTAIFFLIK